MRTTFAILSCVCAAMALAGGCFDTKSFDCGTDDTRCGAAERCINRHCAEANSSCPSGFAYTRSFAGHTAQCVDALPDGGLHCSRPGDACDDGDPCTDGDVCLDATTCKGTPKVCPTPSCTGNALSTSKCVAGACMATMSTCPTGFLCASSTACANTCSTADQCVAGSYCVSGKCLLCTDFLANPSFVPVYGKPTVIPGVGVNTVGMPSDGGTSGGYEGSPALAGDRLTLYFNSDRTGGNGGLDLYRATRATADLTTPFTTPERLVPLNSPNNEIDLSTSDDSFFVYASDRGGSFDIYQTTLSSGAFTTPGLVGGDTMKPINTGAREAHPWITSDGKRLYFETDRDAPGALFRIYLASRVTAQVPFGPAAALTGLDSVNPTWTPQWTSPVLTRDGSALFLINQAVPTKPEVAVVHLDKTTGQPTSVPTTLHGLDLAAGGQLAISADGCTLVMQRKESGEADLWWSQRENINFCNAVPCGAADGCCPAQCNGVVDQDCPFPRTTLVSEYLSNTGSGSHDYLLPGETPKPGYAATGVTFRVFTDALPSTLVLNRFLSTAICGPTNKIVRLGTETTPPMGFVLDKPLGNVFPLNSGNTSGVVRLFRHDIVNPMCDRPMTFDQTCGSDVPNCFPVGFVVKP